MEKRLEFLHGAELQIQKDSHWLSLFDTFLQFPKIIIALLLALEKHTCRWHFSACPPLASGEWVFAKAVVSCLYFCTPISLPGSWGTGMKSGYLSIGGMREYDRTVGLCPFTSSYTSRAHSVRPHNENALEPHGHGFISRVRFVGTSWLHDWHLHSFLGAWIRCLAASLGSSEILRYTPKLSGGPLH